MAAKNAHRQFILEFIEVYRSLPALWDAKCKDYSNRGIKNAQYEVLIAKYREHVADADKQEVVKKINVLRTNFRKELKKIREAESNGVGAMDVKSSLWYFDKMSFLQNLETTNVSTSSRNSLLDAGSTLWDDAENGDSESTNDGRTLSERNTPLEPPWKRQKTEDVPEHLMEMTCRHHQKPPDDHHIIAAAWAVELKNMDPTQQILAKKFISDILFEGQMGTLHRDSLVINHPTIMSVHSIKRSDSPLVQPQFSGRDAYAQ